MFRWFIPSSSLLSFLLVCAATSLAWCNTLITTFCQIMMQWKYVFDPNSNPGFFSAYDVDFSAHDCIGCLSKGSRKLWATHKLKLPRLRYYPMSNMLTVYSFSKMGLVTEVLEWVVNTSGTVNYLGVISYLYWTHWSTSSVAYLDGGAMSLAQLWL